MSKFTDLEQSVMASAKAELAKLPAYLKAELIPAESWFHRNYWPSMLVALAVGIAVGYFV